MRQATCDVWDAYDGGYHICVPTNGFVKSDGACVMGAGVALQAKRRFPRLPYLLGERIRHEGNNVHYFKQLRLFSFPTKHHWSQPADLALILRSARQLLDLYNAMPDIDTIYLPRPGCGNGGLSWARVEPLLDEYLRHIKVIAVANESVSRV